MTAPRPEAPPTREESAAMKPALVVLSREKAEAFVPTLMRAVCISVTDPQSPEAVLHPGFLAVLRLSFHDLSPEDCPEGTPTDCGPAEFMGPADAGAVVRFADLHRDVDVVVIHCEAGVSRSRSIAEALFDSFGRRAPNHHVYERVTAAFRNNHKCGTLASPWIDYRWNPARRGPKESR